MDQLGHEVGVLGMEVVISRDPAGHRAFQGRAGPAHPVPLHRHPSAVAGSSAGSRRTGALTAG